MKIKNIRAYRRYYKEDVQQLNLSNRNEHFVAAYHAQPGQPDEFGFFNLVHGDKRGSGPEGFGAHLVAFLTMAHDGQAVYEFLQNAVDANSSEFLIRWGQIPGVDDKYVMILNDGEPFNLESVQAILNIGMGTKRDDQSKIGKFGIGFKLAHRLVGKNDGLDELVREYQGPILFSWKNEDWRQLIGTDDLQIEPTGDLAKDDDAPWLFKILMTCFPCLPENDITPENVYDVYHNQRSNLFTKKELNDLRAWVTYYQEDIKKRDGFKQGSLFFIRLGEGKEATLENNNLKEGIRFSTAILNQITSKKLSRVVMNDIDVRPPDELTYWSVTIKQDSPEHTHIFDRQRSSTTNSEEKADIHFLLGFTHHTQARDIFANAPNLYLFFPLSEERHGFDFMIHCNAFNMAAPRTYLQKSDNGDGVNERLFPVLVARLAEQMKAWAVSNKREEQERFLILYGNLLLAHESTNTERQWVNEVLIRPIQEFVSANIPVRRGSASYNFELCNKEKKVYILSTQLPLLDTGFLADDKYWFYWSPIFLQSDELLCSQAKITLALEPWTVESLLTESLDTEAFSKWLQEKTLNKSNSF